MQEARKASDAKMVKILGASLKLPESSHWTGSSSVKRYLTLLKNFTNPSIHLFRNQPSFINSFSQNLFKQNGIFHFPPLPPQPLAPPNSHCQTNPRWETHDGPGPVLGSRPPLETLPPLPSVHKLHVSPLQAILAIA